MARLRALNPRILIGIGAILVLFLCVMGFLIYQISTSSPPATPVAVTSETTVEGTDEVATAEATDETVTEATDEATIEATDEVMTEATDEATAEATDEATAEATDEAVTEATDEPTAETTQEATAEATATPRPEKTVEYREVVTEEEQVIAGPSAELLKNGSFEQGFGSDGVGKHWTGFHNEGVAVSFGKENPPFIADGDNAQRITLSQASSTDRYGGIYQHVTGLSAGESYDLTLRGQVRSVVGNSTASNYGYRMEYAVDYTGNTNWAEIPKEEWTELNWDEQPLEGGNVTLQSHKTEIVPSSDELTLFIRGWNKWATAEQTQYTLDGLSLIGETYITTTTRKVEYVPVTRPDTEDEDEGDMEVVADEESDEGHMDHVENNERSTSDEAETMLPVTGNLNSLDDINGKFWGAILVLSFLIFGAIFKRMS